jgi:phosphoribosyl-ATP pyrophosphohydrolase
VDEAAMQNYIMQLTTTTASLGSDVKHLTEAVETLTAQVNDMTAMVNKWKGILFASLVIASLAGASATSVIRKLLGE